MKIDSKEVLRYLGYKNQSLGEELLSLIMECIEETNNIAKENYIYKIYDIEKTLNKIELINSNVILEGSDIMQHLGNSQKCVVMAATIGANIDTKIRYYEKLNLTKAIIMDACATSAIESLCDEVEERMRQEAYEMGYGITYRYSPGYGNLPIELQPKLLNLLEAQKKIGLNASENYILLPRKSVTAIIGLQGLEHKREHPGCSSCKSFKYCQFRKGGDYCGT